MVHLQEKHKAIVKFLMVVLWHSSPNRDGFDARADVTTGARSELPTLAGANGCEVLESFKVNPMELPPARAA